MVGAFAMSLATSCTEDFDAKRRAPPPGTVGDEVYSALCDRLGASVLAEDIEGVTFHDLCHRNSAGQYADKVNQDPAVLPPVSGTAALKRQLSVAKLEALARRRPQLIEALDKTFDNAELPIPHGEGTIGGHKALSEFLKNLVPLYEKDPIDPGAREPLLPSVTRSTGRMLAALSGPAKNDPYTANIDPNVAAAAREALASVAGRQGYRPLRVALGAMRPALGYPALRQLAQTAVPQLGPGGPMRPAFQQVLAQTELELQTSTPIPRPPRYAVDATTGQPNRPRTNVEVGQAMMLSTDPAFAAFDATPRFLVRRDTRGVALPRGGVMAGPFSDANGDGLADVDAFGRFVTAGGTLAPVDPPFFVPTITPIGQLDLYGRPIGGGGDTLYEYVDTSQSLAAALVRDLEPLLEPDEAAPGGGTVSGLLAGAFKLYGAPIEKETAAGKYAGFDTNSSPMLDLIHATGQILAHPNSDSWLLFTKQLMVDHEQALARVIGAALKVREISNNHPEAVLDPRVTIWDEMIEVVVKLTKNEALFKDVLLALTHPDVTGSLGPALANFNRFTDKLTYDPDDINAGPRNLTTGCKPNSGASCAPSTPSDKSQPDMGANRSDWHRYLRIIHDMNGVNACNRAGAKLKAEVCVGSLCIPFNYPIIGTADECELLEFNDIGLLYLDAIIDHYYEPKRTPQAEIKPKSGFLNTLLSLGGQLGLDKDELLEKAAGINGMTTKPTPTAFNRFVFFGAESAKFGNLPDLDPHINGINSGTNEFISSLIEPISTSACPTRTVTTDDVDTGATKQLVVTDCSPSVTWSTGILAGQPGDPKNLLRTRDEGVIFGWETNEFYKGIVPVLQAFDKHDAGDLFLELTEALYRHWSTDQSTDCNPNGTWRKGDPAWNPDYCAFSGVSRYEPILTETFNSDFLPALANVVDIVSKMDIPDPRNNRTRNGLDVMLEITQAFVGPDYAASVGMTDRAGNTQTTWADGTTPTPVTPFNLFANALRGMDDQLNGDPRQARWRAARSNLVDTFLSVDGEGAAAQFRNPTLAKATPILVEVLRQQLNANCPDRESGTACTWGSKDLATKAAESMGGPVFGTSVNLVDQLNEDPATRTELFRFLRYLMQQASDHDALHSTVTSLTDMMQLLADDERMPPIYNAVAAAAAPWQATAGQSQPVPGVADRVLELTQALMDEPVKDGVPTRNPYDPYRVLDRILRNLITPMNADNPASPTPLEVILDTIAEVNRADASKGPGEPLDAQDYQFVFGTVRDFMTSRTRGMEQLYEIIRHRNGK